MTSDHYNIVFTEYHDIAYFYHSPLSYDIDRSMDPTAAVFVPISALNVPPQPRFERSYNEFKSGVAKMQELVATIVEYEEEEVRNFDKEYAAFKKLNTRLLELAKYLTEYIENANKVGSFETSKVWFRGAVTETMTLCHKYSWATVQMIDFIEKTYYEDYEDEDYYEDYNTEYYNE